MKRTYIIAALFLTASLPLFSQVVPAATGNSLPKWSFGGGITDFNPELGRGRLLGGTLWVDYTLPGMPTLLRGVGIELTGRDISFNRSPGELALRVDSAGGGAIYKWGGLSKFRPYAKVTAELTNVDYLGLRNRHIRYNESRTDTSIGGGLEFRAFKSVFVRAEYEYQYLPNFSITRRNSTVGAPLDPQDFTVGATYNVGHVGGAHR
jgi:opacity protein-like surface antigen